MNDLLLYLESHDQKLPYARYAERRIIPSAEEPEPAVRAWIAHPMIPARRALVETARVLPAKDIHELIHELIEELDKRSGDPDLEAEPDDDDDDTEMEMIEDDDESELDPAEEDDVPVSMGDACVQVFAAIGAD